MSTNAALSDTYRFAPSKKTVDVLAHLAKALPKVDVRQYARWIGVRGGMACVTNGFAMLTFHSSEFEGLDITLDRNLFPTSGKFPGFEGLMKAKGKAIDVEDVLVLSRDCKGKVFGKSVFMAIQSESVSLVYQPKEREGLQYFNPALVGDYLRMIPKGHSPIGAWLEPDGQLRIEFTDGVTDEVTFTVIAVAVRPFD